MTLELIFVSISALALFVTGITESICRLVESVWVYKINGWKAQLLSSVVSILLSIGAAYWQIGMFSEPSVIVYTFWKAGLIIGVITGLVSNGMFNTDTALWLLQTVFKIKLPATLIETKKPE